ncbi:hypothetical protein DTW90_37210 [Neorhizobium sp. P12A]|jgi:hypothetical protein|uniref:hypothetical protein n=1 Tax=Neorhizobium sp. P12A TaxID=2268027 RepID=UPI0011EE08C8|nr:hypothetical protein [Neorhizobium sp. P12A]KAA0681162.1 hypothetical protein DTW90_37210 [Neorhizobium sp. P12A]
MVAELLAKHLRIYRAFLLLLLAALIVASPETRAFALIALFPIGPGLIIRYIGPHNEQRLNNPALFRFVLPYKIALFIWQGFSRRRAG